MVPYCTQPPQSNISQSPCLYPKLFCHNYLYTQQNVLAGKDAKKIIKMYNKIARTLVAFEFTWMNAWTKSIDQAKTGLQATLIIRHPDDNKLYVNFDRDIFQLIRESKCLDRMGIEIPERAKIALNAGGEVQDVLQPVELGSR